MTTASEVLAAAARSLPPDQRRAAAKEAVRIDKLLESSRRLFGADARARKILKATACAVGTAHTRYRCLAKGPDFDQWYREQLRAIYLEAVVLLGTGQTLISPPATVDPIDAPDLSAPAMCWPLSESDLRFEKKVRRLQQQSEILDRASRIRS